MGGKIEEVEEQLVRRLCERNGWEYGSGDCDLAVRDVKWFLSQPEICQLFPLESDSKLLTVWLCKYLARFNGNLDYHALPDYRRETYQEMAKEVIAKVRAG